MDQSLVTGGILLLSSTMQGLAAGLVSAVFMRGNTEKTELEKIKAGKFKEVIDTLVAEGKISYTELYKYNNFLKVAKLADKTLLNQQPNNDHSQMDFDWFMRFFDSVGNITNEELHQLWGKVLAGEITQPKTCSLRTLDLIRNLTPDEARAFEKLCKYVLTSGITRFVFDMGFLDEKEGHAECREFMASEGLSYSNSVIPLVEAGLLTLDHDLAFYFAKDDKLQFENKNMLCVIESCSDETILFQQTAPQLTTCGSELFKIISESPDFSFDTEYLHLCVEDLRRANPLFTFNEYSLTD